MVVQINLIKRKGNYGTQEFIKFWYSLSIIIYHYQQLTGFYAWQTSRCHTKTSKNIIFRHPQRVVTGLG